jgi:glycosyltransferase involved in cell wall biosynthesis
MLANDSPSEPTTPPSERHPVPVTFVSSYGRIGGAQIYLEGLLGDLEASWVRDVISLGHGPLNDRLARYGRDVHVIPASGGWLSLATAGWRLRRRLLSQRPGLVHANGVKAAVVSTLATVGTRIPVLWLKHDFAMDGWRARLIGRRCREVVGVSSAVIRTFDRGFSRKAYVVYPGLDPEDIDRLSARQGVIEALGVPPSSFLLALVGQLIPGKGHAELVEILPRLLREHPALVVVFVGGTAYAGNEVYVRQLEDRIRDLELTTATRFVGYREDVHTFTSGCDVLVIPSLPASSGADVEGFPLVALEAMGAQTPVVAYRVGGLPEQLGECGVLVPVRDREALAEAILQLARDPELGNQLGACGRNRVLNRFTRRQMVDGLKLRYRETTAG